MFRRKSAIQLNGITALRKSILIVSLPKLTDFIY